MSEARAIIALTLIFLLAIGSFVGVVGYLSINWPIYLFPTLLALLALSLVFDYRAKRRILDLLETNGYVNIAASEPNTFTGIYRPHWEVAHIQVPLAKRNLLGFPRFEKWCPQFAAHVEFEAEDCDPFVITFVGTPSTRGRYGHMGMMDRRAFVDTIVARKPLREGLQQSR